MSRDDASDFHPRAGRICDQGRPGGRRAPSFVAEVMKAAAKAHGGPLPSGSMAKGQVRGGKAGGAKGNDDDDAPPFDQAKFDDAVIAVARLIGRQMAREAFERRIAANDNQTNL